MNRKNETFRFVEYSYRDIPQAVWEAWMDCARAWHAEPFRAPTWVRDQPWMTSFIPSARLLVGMDVQDNYLGFWPYQLEAKRIRGFLPIRLCCPWGGDNQADPGVAGRQYFWALCPFDPPVGFATAFVHAFLGRTRWNMLQTGDMRNTHPLSLAWTDAIENMRLRVLRRKNDAAVIGPFHSFEDYLTSLSQDWRRRYRQLSRQVESGKICVEQWTVFPGDALERVIQRIGAIYRDSWKAGSEEIAVNLALPGTLDLFSARIASFARENGLHVIFITVNGDDAAFHAAVSHGDISCALQTAYREKYSSHRVGLLAQMEYFRYSIEQGIRERNLLEFKDYKKHFGAAESPSTIYTVFNRDAFGCLAWHTRELPGHLRAIRQRLRKVALKKRLTDSVISSTSVNDKDG